LGLGAERSHFGCLDGTKVIEECLAWWVDSRITGELQGKGHRLGLSG
jgi:hypothetical protein